MIDTIEAWFRLSAERIHEQARALTVLDQAIGDGDHGINMDRGFTAIVASFAAGRPAGESERGIAGAMVRLAGRTLISTVGGAAGPLYGTALMRAGGIIASSEPATPAAEVVVSALEAAIGGVQGLGKATTGEKTMLDALRPAVTAGRTELEAGGNPKAVLEAMAEAAEAGAEATIPMLATKGRASYLGERSIGHQDPGATSAALLVRAMADVVADD
ncbi:MAG: dihydroxyacetone kinase subunit DhaL [Candidatus Limnocylindrales bacterium]